jgi:hypothetical protein
LVPPEPFEKPWFCPVEVFIDGLWNFTFQISLNSLSSDLLFHTTTSIAISLGRLSYAKSKPRVNDVLAQNSLKFFFNSCEVLRGVKPA